MKIDERIEEMQSKLIKILTETNLENKEEGIKLLERFGLDTEYATKLLEAFRNAESAKDAAKDAWNKTLNSRSGDDVSSDIAKSQQRELETRQHFDSINAECALLALARTLAPNNINDEILDKLYEQDIQEEQINNTALKVAYHYYCKTREIEKGRNADLEKVRKFVSEAKATVEKLEKRIVELEKQNEVINKAYINLQYKHSTRIVKDEKHYQEALSQNRELKSQINQLQSRGIFHAIGDKILGRNRIKRLPGKTSELPETLYENTAEKIGMPEIDKDTLSTAINHNQEVSDKQAGKKDELQQ